MSQIENSEFKNELFRINCLEISSEILNQKYEEYPIYFVDDKLDENERMEYEDYVLFGRNGMPNWKDYFAIKNLVETLSEIDGIENEDASFFLSQIEGSFVQTLFSKISLEQQKLNCPLADLFTAMQKLEFFFPEKNDLINFLLQFDSGHAEQDQLSLAHAEFKEIFSDDPYFTKTEKDLIETMLLFPKDKSKAEKKLNKMTSGRKLDRLLDYFNKITVS